MKPALDTSQMIEICFATQFCVYGFMALSLYPYSDFYAAPRMRHSESRPYLRSRRILGTVYILLGIAAAFGVYPALSARHTGWQQPLIPACLTLFYTGHALMLLGLCNWVAMNRKTHALRLLPLPILCGVYAVFPAWGAIVAVLQSIHLVLLISWYTPLFYREYAWLNNCCWDAVNETPDEIASDYDCLPESMPWIGRRYKGLLIITLLGLLAHFLPYNWIGYAMAALFTGFLFWFFYWVFLRFPWFARVLYYYMNEEER